jgi:hypothetical protein
MERKNQERLFYYDPNTLLVSTPRGIYRLHCPFKAKCEKPVALHPAGEVVTVMAVYQSNTKKLLYQVDKFKFSYDNFTVLLPEQAF